MADITPNNSSNNAFADILLSRSFDDPQKKKLKSYGQQLATRIYKQQSINDNLSYYGGRIGQWRENRLWAKGRQKMAEFLDFIGIDGNNAYVKIDLQTQMKGNELYESLVTFLSSNEEYPCVEAIDDSSKDEKEKEKQRALFRFHYLQQLAQLEQASGIPMAGTDDFIPESEMEAEIKFQFDFQLEREIDFQRKLEKVQHDNNYPQMKRRIYRDLCAVNCAATKIEKLHDGFIGIRNCVPENLIYNFFYNDNGRLEITYIGELYSIKICDIRSKYGVSKTNPDGLTEKEIFELGGTAVQFNAINKFNWTWSDSYIYTMDRPYDDYSIDVFDFEIEMPDVDYYTSKIDRSGKENIQLKKGKPDPKSENISVIKTDKTTWMRGVYATQSAKMLYWGLPDIVIKPYMNIAKSLSSYSIIIPNNDGQYVPSIFERALEPLREYTLCKLKIKQLIAGLSPAAMSIDIAGVQDLDIGNGKTIPYTEVIKIAQQTGFRIWNSRGLNPQERNENPFEGLQNGEGITQIIGLGNRINALELEMRALLGVSVYMQGQAVGDRTSNVLVQTQTSNANNVFGFLQYGFQELMEETFNKVCMMNWDEEVIKKDNTGLMDTVFQVAVKMKPTAVEKQLLEQRITTALANQLISFSDAERIRDVKDFKQAAMYLAFREDKKIQQAADEKRQDQQANIQSQQQSAQQAAQQQAQNAKAEMQMKAQIADTESKNRMKEIILTGAFNIMTHGIDVKPEWQGVIDELIHNVSLPLFAQNLQQTQQLGQVMQEASQQQQQESPQDEQQEQPQEPQQQEMQEQQPQQ